MLNRFLTPPSHRRLAWLDIIAGLMIAAIALVNILMARMSGTVAGELLLSAAFLMKGMAERLPTGWRTGAGALRITTGVCLITAALWFTVLLIES
jgi:hypothetical protein